MHKMQQLHTLSFTCVIKMCALMRLVMSLTYKFMHHPLNFSADKMHYICKMYT
jgi:hypothetical protein